MRDTQRPPDDISSAPTIFYLMARYNSRTVIPLDLVCRDYFDHLSPTKLLQKCLRGEIALPIYRAEASQKGMRGVHIVDLASYIDKRREAAIQECKQLCGQE
jgi:hypothetical protein